MENYTCFLEYKHFLSDIYVEMEDIYGFIVTNIMTIGSNHSRFAEVIVCMKSLTFVLFG